MKLSKLKLLCGVMIGASMSTAVCELVTSKVSASKINRLELSRSPVTQIIGDESKYSILTDEMGMNIFFVSKVPAGETIEMSLVDSGGAVVDLSMRAENIAGQVIKIREEDKVKSAVQELVKSNNDIAAMLKSMIKDEAGKYYKQSVRRKINTKTEGVEVIQDRSYRFGNLEGARLIVGNRSIRGGVIFTEENFKSLFEGLKAVSIERKFLGLGRSGYVYVIAEGVAK